MTRHISPPATPFFAYKTIVLGLFKLNIKVRHKIREFLKDGKEQTLTQGEIPNSIFLLHKHWAWFRMSVSVCPPPS